MDSQVFSWGYGGTFRKMSDRHESCILQNWKPQTPLGSVTFEGCHRAEPVPLSQLRAGEEALSRAGCCRAVLPSLPWCLGGSGAALVPRGDGAQPGAHWVLARLG